MAKFRANHNAAQRNIERKRARAGFSTKSSEMLAECSRFVAVLRCGEAAYTSDLCFTLSQVMQFNSKGIPGEFRTN